MNCPKCSTTLSISQRHGVEIDYCPSCRGVWLDRQELDKIIERELQFAAPQANPRGGGVDGRRHDDDDDDRHERRYSDDDRGYRGKRKSFWSELFD